MTGARHLLLTLRPDPDAQAFFNALRRQHFPRHKNHLDAHITLLYRIHTTAEQAGILLADVRERPRLQIRVSGLQQLDNGVAYLLQSDLLQELHLQLQHCFDPFLIPRDRRPLQPHITIQNSVTAFRAQRLYMQLQPGFHPFSFEATGLDLWEYRKGPWQLAQSFSFL